ncbi:hypothetical protein RF11_04040 [Thelohanellus kitauei]|uniref:Uncharacterized protein n=1 Tax=Thelohanellus kitauei TaxID=669202 RepID=A0A0C2N596_THEKT|nr:hypothetical protein RF11_04040 [Thelohanellus kitauei]
MELTNTYEYRSYANFTGWRFECHQRPIDVDLSETVIVYPGQDYEVIINDVPFKTRIRCTYHVFDGLVSWDPYFGDFKLNNLRLLTRENNDIPRNRENHVLLYEAKPEITRCILFGKPLILFEYIENGETYASFFYGMTSYGEKNQLRILEKIRSQLISMCKASRLQEAAQIEHFTWFS